MDRIDIQAVGIINVSPSQIRYLFSWNDILSHASTSKLGIGVIGLASFFLGCLRLLPFALPIVFLFDRLFVALVEV